MSELDENQKQSNDRQSESDEGPTEAITEAVLHHVAGIAELARAAAIFVYVHALEGKTLPLPDSLTPKVYYITKTSGEDARQRELDTRFIRVPNVPLSRLGQVKVAIFVALSRGLVRYGDTVVFLSGLPARGTLDTIIITQVGREYEILSSPSETAPLPPDIRPEVMERVIDIASQLGSEGREGKPVGTLFIVGDADRVRSMSRPLILNPFRGYPESDRNILDLALTETVKELSTIDGAFVIRGDGVIESGGAFLKTASQREFELPRGLGARHHAAAAITALADAVAVAVSESTGTVTIFRAGSILTEIEKPPPVSSVHRLPEAGANHFTGFSEVNGGNARCKDD